MSRNAINILMFPNMKKEETRARDNSPVDGRLREEADMMVQGQKRCIPAGGTDSQVMVLWERLVH
jgi:hypothetical protein